MIQESSLVKQGAGEGTSMTSPEAIAEKWLIEKRKVPIEFIERYRNDPNLSEDIVRRFMLLRAPMAIGSAVSSVAAFVRDGLGVGFGESRKDSGQPRHRQGV
jgi:hypothetical protein